MRILIVMMVLALAGTMFAGCACQNNDCVVSTGEMDCTTCEEPCEEPCEDADQCPAESGSMGAISDFSSDCPEGGKADCPEGGKFDCPEGGKSDCPEGAQKSDCSDK